MFKVGDKVKIIDTSDIAINRCGTVIGVRGNGFYYRRIYEQLRGD